eukprot:30816_6
MMLLEWLLNRVVCFNRLLHRWENKVRLESAHRLYLPLHVLWIHSVSLGFLV